MMELHNHPFFFAVQFHPEFTSNPRFGHPLFKAYIEAAVKHREAAEEAEKLRPKTRLTKKPPGFSHRTSGGFSEIHSPFKETRFAALRI